MQRYRQSRHVDASRAARQPLLRRPLLAILTPVLAVACVSTTSADLSRYRREHRFPVSTDGVPAGHQAVAALAYARTGFYLLGLIPIVPVDLSAAVTKVVDEARALGATGIANLHYEFEPASSLRFVVFPLPDWSASLHVTATAYMPIAAAYPTIESQPTPPDPVSGTDPSTPGR